LNALKPYVLPAINAELPFIFWNVKGLNLTNLQLGVNDVKVVDSMVLNERVWALDKMSVLFIMLLISLAGTAIFCSVMSQVIYKRKKHQSKE